MARDSVRGPMIDPDDNALSSERISSVIDFETAVLRITSARLATALVQLASNESIRVIEALASTIANSLRSESDLDQPFAYERVRLLRQMRSVPGMDPTRIEMIRMVAKRALCGSLPDPTRGANAFHRVEKTPDWAKDVLPSAVFGSFIFYRL